MKMKWQLIESVGLSAEEIMAKDFELLNQLDGESQIILHFYEWAKPSLTYGYFINPSKHLNINALKKEGIDFAKRPTGGGIIFHLGDFAFSILIPAHHPCISLNPLANYHYINNHISHIVCELTKKKHSIELLKQGTTQTRSNVDAFCMAKPTQYDIIIDGKKIGGAAQRKTKKGLLHQASLSLIPISETWMKKFLIYDQEILRSMKEQSGFLIENSCVSINQVYQELKSLLIKQIVHF